MNTKQAHKIWKQEIRLHSIQLQIIETKYFKLHLF
jgi:hypothetical protein